MKKQPADLITDRYEAHLKILKLILSNIGLCLYTLISRAEGE